MYLAVSLDLGMKCTFFKQPSHTRMLQPPAMETETQNHYSTVLIEHVYILEHSVLEDSVLEYSVLEHRT